MNIASNRILLVYDEPGARRSLHMILTRIGFEISEAAGEEETLSFVRTRRFDAVLLDLKMPGNGGLEICRRLRDFSARIPIFIVTVRTSAKNAVGAFEAGADDYVTRPFHLQELIARLRGSIRRSRLAEYERGEPVLAIGDIELDPEHHLLRKGGQRIHLTPTEFELLRFLMSHAGKPVPHESLLKSVWGSEYRGELEYLRTFVRQIRKKIEDDPANPKYVLTDPHIGYRFAAKL